MENAVEVRSISPVELSERWRRGETLDVIDVRPAVEYAEAHVPMARSVPWHAFDPREVMDGRADSARGPLFVVCQIGKRSATACERFIEAGFRDVVNVEGGTDAWRAAGLPVQGQSGVVTLRRQVQMTTGSLVMLAAILAFFVHPLFFVLSTLIGAGMIYAGASNSCAMGMILARMPWNRKVPAASTPATQ